MDNINNKYNDHEEEEEKKVSVRDFIESQNIKEVIGEMLSELLHIRDPNPYVYMVKFLAGRVSEEAMRENGITIDPPYPSGRPIVKFPKNVNISSSLLSKYLKKEVWNEIKYRKTKFDGNINHICTLIENSPFDPIGCILTDGYCVETFKEILFPIIYDVHFKTKENEKEENQENLENFKFNENSYDSIDDDEIFLHLNKTLLKFSISISRNVSNVPFNKYMSSETRAYIDKFFHNLITTLVSEKAFPNLQKYDMASNQTHCDLILNQIKFNMDFINKAGLSQNWPYDRSIYSTDDNTVVILINFIDHFYLNVNGVNYGERTINITDIINLCFKMMGHLDIDVAWEKKKNLGYITTEISHIGEGLVLNSEMNVEKMHQESRVDFNGLLSAMKFDIYNFNPNKYEKTKLFLGRAYKLREKNFDFFLKDYCSCVGGIKSIDDMVTSSKMEEVLEKFKKHSLEKEKIDTVIKNTYEKCFDTMKYKLAGDGLNINDIILYDKKGEKSGVVLLREKIEYDAFSNFIKELLIEKQNFDISKREHIHKKTSDDLVVQNIFSDNISLNNRICTKIKKLSIILRRNINKLKFPWSCKEGEKYSPRSVECIEKLVEELNKEVTDESKKVKFYLLPKAKKNIKELFDYLRDPIDLNEINKSDTYKGLIVFPPKAPNSSLFGVVNDIDHLKLVFNIEKIQNSYRDIFVSFLQNINRISKYISFSYDMGLGFITANPYYIGTGMKIQITIQPLKKTTIEKIESLSKYIIHRVISYTIVGEDAIIIFNNSTIGYSEEEIISIIYSCIDSIVTFDGSSERKKTVRLKFKGSNK